jgi:hypothetical protein
VGAVKGKRNSQVVSSLIAAKGFASSTLECNNFSAEYLKKDFGARVEGDVVTELK